MDGHEGAEGGGGQRGSACISCLLLGLESQSGVWSDQDADERLRGTPGVRLGRECSKSPDCLPLTGLSRGACLPAPAPPDRKPEL